MTKLLAGAFGMLLPTIRRGDCIDVAPSGFWRRRSSPGRSLRRTARLFEEMEGETIIEIGTGIHGRMAGNSMLVWCGRTSARKIVAVDLDPDRLDEVRRAVRGNVELVQEDGIDYLKGFSARIDLLYLDFWTQDPEGSLPGTGRALAYVEAYRAARHKLNDRSMILIDDTDHVHPWKHTYIVPEARRDGFAVVHTGRQTLMLRRGRERERARAEGSSAATP